MSDRYATIIHTADGSPRRFPKIITDIVGIGLFGRWRANVYVVRPRPKVGFAKVGTVHFIKEWDAREAEKLIEAAYEAGYADGLASLDAVLATRAATC